MMKKLLQITLGFQLMLSIAQAQCSGSELSGSTTISFPVEERMLTFNIYHGFSLTPATATLPVVKAYSYNHAFVTETNPSCGAADVNPFSQTPGYEIYRKDTFIDNVMLNGTLPVLYKWSTISPAGTSGTITDTAFAYICTSKAKASSCIDINPFSAGMPVTGEIQNYGFGQAINPPVHADPFAVSIGGVTAESTRKLKNGTIVWIPWIESLSKGKAHGIRQKAGTNDPITYYIHNYTNGLDYAGTLLTISMTFYTDTDTVTYYNKWKNDTVLITSDSAEFKIEFPSVLTSLNGHILVKVSNGMVTTASKSGFFTGVPLPTIGTPVPVAFWLPNILNFNYDLGNFGTDSLQVIINMFGNSINNHTPAGLILIYDSVNHVTCFGKKTGSIYINAAGKYPPFTYLWNNGATIKNRGAVKAGTYTVTVTDAQGNTFSKTIVVNQPAKLSASVVKDNIKCGGKNTGKITLTVSGGTPPYSFLWNTGHTTSIIDSLFMGTYVATITDANGCTLTKTVTLTENPPLSIAAFTLGADSAIAFGSGGVPPYVYRWFTTPAQSSQIAVGLIGGGLYKVRVTDSKSCTATIMYAHPFSRLGHAESVNNIKAIPNPTTGIVALHGLTYDDGIVSIRITDITGKVLYFEKTQIAKQLTFDFSKYNIGIYFIHVNSDRHATVLKIMKQ